MKFVPLIDEKIGGFLPYQQKCKVLEVKLSVGIFSTGGVALMEMFLAIVGLALTYAIIHEIKK